MESSELYIALNEEYIAPSEFEDVYEQARRIPPRWVCPWFYQLPEEIRRAKDLNNREPLNREPNNQCSYLNFLDRRYTAERQLLNGCHNRGSVLSPGFGGRIQIQLS